MNHGGPAIRSLVPEKLAVRRLVGTNAFGFIIEGVARYVAALQKHIVLGGIAKHGAEDVLLRRPDLPAALEVKNAEARGETRLFTAAPQLAELLAGKAINRVKPAAADAGSVMA